MKSQTFWVFVVAVLLCCGMSIGTSSFGQLENLSNISRNLSFVALMALGQTVVIISGGIDLSVGSLMALAGVSTGLTLQAGHSLGAGICAGIGIALLAGLINGVLIARLRLSPFVVTLGMMSVARSIALVLSGNRTLYELGPDQNIFLSIGSWELFGITAPVVALVVAVALCCFAFLKTRWGLRLFAIGGNEEAARRTGVRVAHIKISAYLLSALSAGVAGVLTVAWLGSVTSSLGTGYELQVIAAAVIGGAHLAGGAGNAFGAIVGAALIEIIRNSLLLAGVDPYWQGSFVGAFIILAVIIGAVRQRGSEA